MTTMKRMLAVLLCIVLVTAAVPVSASAAETTATAWDGKTIDVSWYSPDATTYYISTPAQLMGLAAIVNGIYNAEITTVIGNEAYIVDNVGGEELSSGSSNLSTSSYHYGSDDFNGKTVYLTADLDMGGVYNAATDTWSGPNYMPIGGQYLMTKNDSATKLGSSFCGTLDGQGHMIYNIYCDRHCSSGNYGDGSSVGLIGRLGVHDSDPESSRPASPTVRNLGITGYIHGNRSVGGIVGKIGKTVSGAVIENCANFATVSNTDAKGCGGIVGAGWNGGVIRNCYNAGTISSSYACPTGGISGSNEITIESCYNIGTISAASDSYAMGIGTNNGGGTDVTNCFWLAESAPGGGYYGKTNGTVTQCSAAELKSAATLKKLGSAFTADTTGLNGGYPILTWQVGTSLTSSAEPYVETVTDIDPTAWYAVYYQYVTEQGLMDLMTSSTFGPDAPMTRAMLATALYRLAGSPWTAGVSQFSDVPATADYAKAVAWAYEKGVVTGTSDTTFAPDNTITREQIAAMFYRYAQNVAKADMTVSGDLSAYQDRTKVSSWASDSMAWAVGAGLINGTSTTTLTPQGTATRIQTAAMLTRLAAALS